VPASGERAGTRSEEEADRDFHASRSLSAAVACGYNQASWTECLAAIAGLLVSAAAVILEIIYELIYAEHEIDLWTLNSSTSFWLGHSPLPDGDRIHPRTPIIRGELDHHEILVVVIILIVFGVLAVAFIPLIDPANYR